MKKIILYTICIVFGTSPIKSMDAINNTKTKKSHKNKDTVSAINTETDKNCTELNQSGTTIPKIMSRRGLDKEDICLVGTGIFCCVTSGGLLGLLAYGIPAANVATFALASKYVFCAQGLCSFTAGSLYTTYACCGD
jgi:hypothetical protein